jgi:hypothetical protein
MLHGGHTAQPDLGIYFVSLPTLNDASCDRLPCLSCRGPSLPLCPRDVHLLRLPIFYSACPCYLCVSVSSFILFFLLPLAKPRPETTTMNHETHTFHHARGTFGAFTAKRDKWFYEELLHNIGWNAENDCGTFLLDDGHVETYKIKLVDEATLRLQKGDYAISQYKQGLNAGMHKCRMARIKIAKAAGEWDGKTST